MKTAHFNLILIGLLAVVGALGYVSFSTIRFGTANVDTVKEATGTQTTTPTDTEAVTPADTVATTPETPATTTPTEAPAATTTGVPAKYADLAKRIQGLIDDQVQMKAGSSGTRVGTVQEFLNVYDPAGSVAPNNNYGPATTTRTKKFQAEVGVPTSGYAGPKTYAAMLKWLETKAPRS
jgi:murein L,D-transpeptidase YcbB/YkuD